MTIRDKSSANAIPPFLRWAGSKRQLLPTLGSYWPSSALRYVEPFAGSAALFFHLAPRRALLGDTNLELISTYRQVRRHPRAVAAALAKLKKGRLSYTRLRGLDPSDLDPIDGAARFIFLNRYSFNGLYRTNRAGRFNVPYGGGRTGALPPLSRLAECARLLRSASLVCASFQITLEQARPGDFAYLDPPYYVNSRRVFREYDPSGFDALCVRTLRQWLLKLDRANIPFLLSYADSEEAHLLRKGFHSTSVPVRRNIAGFASGRKVATELLITNSPPQAG